MNQSNSQDLQQKLLAWAEQVVNEYNPIAQSEKVNYYTQSDLTQIKESPNLLLLGINPGSAGGNGKQLSAEEFLKGNPQYPQKGSWVMWQRLCRLFSQGGMQEVLQNDESLVWSNVFHLNSKKESGLTSPMKAPKVVELTRELIRVLHPQRVLCLGGANCLYQLFPKHEATLEELIPSTLWYTKLGSTPIYGIPHTSSCYTNEQTELLGKALAFLFDAPEAERTAEMIAVTFSQELQAYRERLKGSGEKVFLQEVGRIVKDSTNLESSDSKNLIYLNEYVQALVADTSDRSLNVSYRDKYRQTLPKRDEIVRLLGQREAWNNKQYVPFKKEVPSNIFRIKFDPELKTYMAQENGAEDFANLIRRELEALANELNKIFND